jgi:repressor LexA
MSPARKPVKKSASRSASVNRKNRRSSANGPADDFTSVTEPNPQGSTRERMLHLILQGQGRPATVRELAEELGLSSPASAHRHLKNLAEEGLIMQVPGGGSRSWAPCPTHAVIHDPEKTIPVVGRIAAGIPIESCLDQGLNPDEWLEMGPAAFGQKRDVVALLVEGESMRDAGIHSGDHAVIRRQSKVENGEIAAVTIEGEGTLKCWRIKTGRGKKSNIYLEAAHPDFPPLELNADMGEIQIFGKLIGVVRRFRRPSTTVSSRPSSPRSSASR